MIYCFDLTILFYSNGDYADSVNQILVVKKNVFYSVYII